MRLLGFHLGDPAFPLSGTGDGPASVSIQARGVGNAGPVSIRVSSLDWRMHYHMDTNQLDARGTYPWNTAILRRVQLEARSLAALACNNDCRSEAQTRFFPVTIGAPAKTTAPPVPTLVVESSVALSQLKLVVSHGVAKDPERDMGSDYAEHEPITLRLQGSLLPGDNDVVLTGFDASGAKVVSWWGRLVLP